LCVTVMTDYRNQTALTPFARVQRVRQMRSQIREGLPSKGTLDVHG
jgi:hypothetical protein